MPYKDKDLRTFLHPYQALDLVIDNSSLLSSENIKLIESYNRALVNDLFATYDDPPFNKSSMDGYAYSSLNNTKTFKAINKTIQAGDELNIEVPLGSALKIMTGAQVPKNCDMVARVEWTNNTDNIITFTKEETTSNIIKQGENVSKGQLILNKKILKPKDIGILASAGFETIEVYKKMKVAVFSTGKELICIGTKITGSKIYDSNGYMLFTSLLELNCDVSFLGIIEDDENIIKENIEKVINDYDLIILSGGVSMGDYDYIPRVLDSLNVKQIFHGIKMKPGKPCYFGKLNNKAIFALPGNPLSSYVCFNLFVKSYILSCIKMYKGLNIIKAIITTHYKRNDNERFEFIPSFVDISSGQVLVTPIVAKSSSMLQVLNNTNSFIIIEAMYNSFNKGSEVQVLLLRC